MILKNISFSYKETQVLSKFSFDFSKKSHVYLIEGENGSGKSTLLKIMAGLLVNFDGVRENNYFKTVSYSSTLNGLYPYLSGEENINFFTPNYDHKLKTELVNALSLSSHISKKVSKMSDGTKAKISFLIALLYQTELVLLDEPFNGLDLKTSKNIIDLMFKFIETKKMCFILTSHINTSTILENINVSLLNITKLI